MCAHAYFLEVFKSGECRYWRESKTLALHLSGQVFLAYSLKGRDVDWLLVQVNIHSDFTKS